MVLVCAWCKKFMGFTKDDEIGISHGICAECLVDVIEELDRSEEPEPEDVETLEA